MSVTLTASPAGTDLITPDRAMQEPGLADLFASNPNAISPLISAATAAIHHACKRLFPAQDYSLVLEIGACSCDWIALPNFPVIAVTRLACNAQPAMTVSNTSGDNQRASVSTTTAGALRLMSTSAGVNSTVDLSPTTYPTIDALATAIAAIGNGWTATATDGLKQFPSVDLWPITAALPVLNRSTILCIFTDELLPWPDTQSVWNWAGSSSRTTSGWQLDPDAGLIVGRFGKSVGDSSDSSMILRCDYRAGFEIIPADVQQACARLAALMAEDAQRNSVVLQETIGPYTQKFAASATELIGNPAVMGLIRPYIDHAKTIGHVWP